MFSAIEYSSTRPRRWRSSGMCPMPGLEVLVHGVVRDVLAGDAHRSPTSIGAQARRARRSARSGRSRRCRRCRRSRRPAPRTRRRAPSRARGRRGRAASSTCEQRLAGRRRRLLHAEQHLAPDHQPGEARPRSRPPRGSVSISLPRRRTVIRSAISSTSFSLCDDEDDRLAVRRQAADDLEQLLRLLRREHGGRLVEDEDVRARGRAPSGSRRAAAGRP